MGFAGSQGLRKLLKNKEERERTEWRKRELQIFQTEVYIWSLQIDKTMHFYSFFGYCCRRAESVYQALSCLWYQFSECGLFVRALCQGILIGAIGLDLSCQAISCICDSFCECVYPGRRCPRTEVAVTGWSQWLPEGGTLDHRLNVFSLTVCGGEFGERTDQIACWKSCVGFGGMFQKRFSPGVPNTHTHSHKYMQSPISTRFRASHVSSQQPKSSQFAPIYIPLSGNINWGQFVWI